MFKRLLSDNRVFVAAVCLLVFIAAGLGYLHTVKHQVSRRDVLRTPKSLEERQPPKTEAPANVLLNTNRR